MLKQESVTKLDAHTTSIEFSGTFLSLLPGITVPEVSAIYKDIGLLTRAFDAVKAIGEPDAPGAKPPPPPEEVARAYEELLALKVKFAPPQP